MNQATISQIQAGQVWTEQGFLSRQTISLSGDKISAVGPTDQVQPAETGVIEAPDCYVIPGLIDLQVNGALGWSFQAAHQAHFAEVIDFHLAQGTTTMLPTLVTAPAETLLNSLDVLAAYIEQAGSNMLPGIHLPGIHLPGIHLPGIHLEGPFLAAEKRGAHDEAALLMPDLDLARQFAAAAQGRLKLLTLAPELPGAAPLIEHFAAEGVVVSAGHSAATYADMQAAVAAGLTMVTHAGNASDWPHRALGQLGFLTSQPGLVGSLMALDRLAGSIILDGYHFHPALLKPLLQLKGPDQLILVSDAAPVAGCPPGDYDSGGLQVTVHPQGFATSGRGGGWLAGSIITLLTAVQRAVALAEIPLHQAVAMASLGPARLLNLADQLGQIQPGYQADLLILNPDLSLRQVIVGGVVNG